MHNRVEARKDWRTASRHAIHIAASVEDRSQHIIYHWFNALNEFEYEQMEYSRITWTISR